jgi:hypothetical protein
MIIAVSVLIAEFTARNPPDVHRDTSGAVLLDPVIGTI